MISKLAALFLIVTSAWCSVAIAIPAESGSRCSISPAEEQRLSNYFLGLIRRDDAGNTIASVWSSHGYDIGYDIKLVSHHVEGSIVRLVVRYDRTKTCPPGSAMEAYVKFPHLPIGRNYQVQAEEWVATQSLAPRGTVHISRAFDCGGPLSEEYRKAEENRTFVTPVVIGDQTLKVTVLARYSGGTFLEPKADLKGNQLEVGYVERTSDGPAPACVFSERINFLVTGVPARDISVKLVTGTRAYFYVALGIGGIILIGLWIRKRRTHADKA